MAFILQWNLNGFYTHFEMLKLLISEHQPKVICLQETHFKDNQKGTQKNFTTFVKNRINRHASGGVAIYVSNDVDSTEIQINTDLEAVAVSLKTPVTINICNIYIPPNFTISENDLNNLLLQIPQPRIILGDFSSHNIIWGANNTSIQGRMLAKVLDNFGLILPNNGEPTHFSTHNAPHLYWTFVQATSA